MQNKIFLVTLFFILIIKTSLSQRNFNAGVDIGGTSSQISGDGFYGFGQFGLTGALFVNYPFNENWSTTLQIGWNAKGARKYVNASNAVGYRLRANYIDIPIWLEYHYHSFRFFAGPSVNVHINHKELINNVPSSPVRDFKNLEWAVNLGLAYQINDHFLVRSYFANSILPVRDHLNPNAYPTPQLLLGNFHRSILNKGQYFTSITLKISYFFSPI